MDDGLRPAVFLDRDGTLVQEREYLADPEGVELVPGAADAVRALREAGFAVVAVTNQSGIARGYYAEADYRAVAARLDALLGRAGAPLDGTWYCPHHPDHTGPCACRKPATGLYRCAAQALGLSLADSWYVGDRVKDVVPALVLGGRGLLVRTGYGRRDEEHVPPGIGVVDDIRGVAERVLRSGGGAGAPVDPSGGLR